MILADSLIFSFTPLVLFACAVAMIVLRAGVSRIFFDIVGTMQAEKLIKDSKANATILEALYLDALSGIQEGFMELGTPFTQMLDDVMPIGKEIGEAARQFEKFVNTGEDIDELNAQIIEIGNSFGFSADQSFDAAAKMAQLAGVLGTGSTATGTEVGMAFGMISGMSTEAAMQRMVNLQQQTGFMTKGIDENTGALIRNNMIRENSFRIMDQLNSIENTSVATMSQLTFVMNQFAAQANLAGESIASMAAMSAVLIESGEEQGKAGRALRMIYARLGADTAGARKALEELGVAVIDAETGALRPLSDVLVDIQPHYQNMTGEQKQNLAQTIAGNVHYTRLIKLLEGTSRMQDLHTEAMEGAFPAQEEINRLQETNLFNLEQMEAKLKDVKGALAEELMPTMTESTKVQMVFFDTMAKAAGSGGTIGFVTKGLFNMANMMRTVIGPFAQQILSVMHLRIATETLHHVRRAMNREDMFHLVTKKALNAEIEKENALVRGSTIPVTEEEIQKRTKLIQRYEREIASIEAKNNATEKELALAESRRRTVEKHKADIASSTLSHQAETDAIMAKNAAFNGLTMGIGVTGSAMMMFGGSQRAIRAGMILNTTALSLQVFKLMASTIATNKDTIAKMKNTVSAALAFRGNIKLSISFEAVAKSAKSAAASTLGFILSIAPLAGFFLALGGIAYVLAGTIDDVSDSVDGTNQSFVNLSETIDVVNQMSMDEIQANIESTQASIDNLKDTESDLGKEILTTKQNDLDKYKQSKQLALLQTKDAQELARKIEEAQKLSDKRQKGRDFDFKRGRFTRTSSERARAMSALRRENKELFEALEEN